MEAERDALAAERDVLKEGVKAYAAELAHWKDCHGVTADALAVEKARLQALEKELDDMTATLRVANDLIDELQCQISPSGEEISQREAEHCAGESASETQGQTDSAAGGSNG